ncbi:MAG: hypothetical protein C0595_14220 [Marinilabiliales bacterium]|nr:MAG: hypothetical protein C0595_14220 [Marinilabiliales bacterium]
MKNMEGRILTKDWDLYDTRHVVYKTRSLSPEELENGYWWAYKEFYKWNNVFKASFGHDDFAHQMKHLFYTGGWKKFESLWNIIINAGGLKKMLPILELLLSKVENKNYNSQDSLIKYSKGDVKFDNDNIELLA